MRKAKKSLYPLKREKLILFLCDARKPTVRTIFGFAPPNLRLFPIYIRERFFFVKRKRQKPRLHIRDRRVDFLFSFDDIEIFVIGAIFIEYFTSLDFDDTICDGVHQLLIVRG